MSKRKDNGPWNRDYESVIAARLDAVPDWIWEVDVNGVFTYSNRVVESILGLASGRLLGSSVFDLLAPGDRSKCREVFQRAVEGAQPVCNVVAHFLRVDGNIRTLEVSCVPITQNGRLLGLRGIARDITDTIFEQRAAQEALANYRAALDNAPTGIVIVQNEQVAYANPRILELTGYTLEEARDSGVWGFIHPDDRERVKDHYRRRMSGMESPEHYEVRVIAKSGEVRYVELRATVVTYQGAPAVLDNIVDITERRLAEDALRDSEERYRLLFERSPEVVLLLKGPVFVDANPAVTGVFGYLPEQIIGMRPWQISPELQPDGRKSIEKARQMIENAEIGGPQHFEWIHQAKDGRLLDCEVSLAAYRVRGERFVQAIVRDVTERKRAEEHRRAFERQMERQKRQFYRDTILSVTDGKLDICEAPEIRPYVSTADVKITLRGAEEVAGVRRQIESYCAEHGLAGERLDSFVIAVGEAITNAVKHASGGRAYAGVRRGSVWVGVADRGGGISSLILPRATLLRGFSTKPSLGLGYTIMLSVADSILLRTGDRGTTVILTKQIEERETIVSPDMLPDTWRNVPDL